MIVVSTCTKASTFKTAKVKGTQGGRVGFWVHDRRGDERKKVQRFVEGFNLINSSLLAWIKALTGLWDLLITIAFPTDE
jgi:hypothetical protein